MAPDAPPETITPASEEDLARVLADADGRGLKVAPRGGGTKSDWGHPPQRIDLVLSTLGLDRVLEHAAGDMTVTVEAGCTIAALQQHVALRGQRLALDPLWPDRATVGGVLATNDSGPLRHAFGTARDLLLGVTVALPDGTLARAGGKVVKNVAGFDLPKLMVGAYGTLGVITRATFRLHPLPRATQTFSFNVPWDRLAGFVYALRALPLAMTGLEVMARRQMHAGVRVWVEGSPEGVDAAAAVIATVADTHGARPHVPPKGTTSERELQWLGPGPLAKVTFPPATVAALCGAVRDAGGVLVAEAAGEGLVVFPDADADIVPKLARFVAALGGCFVLLRGEPGLKREVNSAAMGDALPLMQRVKQQFDPAGTLNPGRFIGGI
jgi:glycolate oxidase FAD binding subunit